MDDRWKLKPDKEIMDYLEGDGRERIRLFQSPEREPEIDGPDVNNYVKVFNEWNSKVWNQNGVGLGKAYLRIEKFGPLPSSQAEIQALADAMPEEDAEAAGLFISYLVNRVYPYDEIELKINKPFCHLGIGNKKKKWKIVGDAGDHIGGGFEGGEMTIYGNTGGGTGVYMKGGKIVVNGNAGGSVGERMTGGEIYLNGDYYSLGDVKGGSVYHKGHNLSRLRAQTRSGTLPPW